MSANNFNQFEPRSAPLPQPGRERPKTFTEVLSERAQLENRMKDIDADLRKQNMDAEDIHHPRVPRYNFQEYPKMLYHSDGKTTTMVNGAHEEVAMRAKGFSDQAHQPEWAQPEAINVAQTPVDPRFNEAVGQLVQRGYSVKSATEIVTVEGIDSILATSEPEPETLKPGDTFTIAQTNVVNAPVEDTWPDEPAEKPKRGRK
jgi:hypothetical protein